MDKKWWWVILIIILILIVLFVFGGLNLFTGQAILRTNTCTDSDGGLNYYVQGTVYGYNSSAGNYSYTDACVNSIRLEEWYCYGTYPQYQLHDCPTNYSCSNGACVITNQTHKICSGSNCITISGAGTDQCTDNSECNNQTNPRPPTLTINNYYVDSSNVAHINVTAYDNNWEVMYVDVKGPNEYVNPMRDQKTCSGHYCNRELSFSYAAIYDNYGDTYNVRTVNLYGLYNSTQIVITFNNETCTDSDGGINSAVRGNVSGRYSNGTYYNYVDACMLTNSTMLKEWYCSPNNPLSRSISCFCSGGKCNGLATFKD